MKKNIAREDAIAAIGFDGNAALVDKNFKKNCASMSTKELAEAGFYRAAAASAVFSGESDELAVVTRIYNEKSGSSYAPETVSRIFGTGIISVKRVLYI